MDIFQSLRKIQKKERDNGTLAQVEENFYSQIHTYLNELKQSAIDDPFSDVYNTLNEARRIATEICEKREHKITQAAVLNINRSYNLFSGKQDFDLVDSMPLNLTPEEEVFYFSLIETLKNHKLSLSGIEAPKPQIPRETVIESPFNDVSSEDDSEVVDVPASDDEEILKEEPSEKEVKTTSNSLGDIADMAMGSSKGDEVLDRIDEIRPKLRAAVRSYPLPVLQTLWCRLQLTRNPRGLSSALALKSLLLQVPFCFTARLQARCTELYIGSSLLSDSLFCRPKGAFCIA